MSTPGSTDVLLCARCGRPCTEVDGGRDWMHLEVTRERALDDFHWWEVDFCTQAHAAEWLQAPLPEPDPAPPVSRTWADRWAGAGCFAVFAFVVFLTSLGAWTALRFLVDLL